MDAKERPAATAVRLPHLFQKWPCRRKPAGTKICPRRHPACQFAGLASANQFRLPPKIRNLTLRKPARMTRRLETSMKKSTYAIAVLALAATVLPAQANPPKFKATCPTNIEVKANNKGRVRINGEEAKIKENSATAWDATQGDVTVTIGVEGKSLQVVYTSKGGVNGVCKVTDYEASTAAAN
jgi:hypothetical protein